MPYLRIVRLGPLLLLISASAPTAVGAPVDPMRFFVGRTVSVGEVKILLQKKYGTHSTGVGRFEPDGSLLLVQQVFDDGRSSHQRSWHIRKIGAGRYAGTMSEAVGPVTIDKVGDQYRFRFAMDGHLNVEQVMTPLPSGRVASSSARIRKYGFVVATTTGFVRKVG